MVNAILARGNFRYFRRHRWQSLLIILGITLGVAVVVAVDVANESARRALALSVDTLSGGSSHRIVAGAGPVPQTLLARLRVDPGIHRSAPVITDHVSLKGETFTLLGIDGIAELALERQRSPPLSGGVTGLMTSDGVFLPAGVAARLKLEPGERLVLEYRGSSPVTTLAGLFSGEEGISTSGLIVADIAVAQTLLGRGDAIDRIDLVLEPAEVERIRAWLPAGFTLVDSSERDRSLAAMTDTFHLNLTAMSLLALLVGGLLIYNTMAFAVLQRRRTWAIFRSLGGTRRDLMGLILFEALVLSTIGTLLGLVLGLALAAGLVGLMMRTVDDLYFVLTVTDFSIDYISLAKGGLLGMGATLLAALMPARAVAEEPPAALLRRGYIESRSHTRLSVQAALALGLLAAGLGLAVISDESLITGFAALALQVFGVCALAPVLIALSVGALRYCLNPVLTPAARAGLLAVGAGLSRAGVAVAALSVAVAATVAMAVMVASFRTSLETWLEQTLSGDLYVSLAGTGRSSATAGIPPVFLDNVETLSGVSHLEMRRFTTVESELGPVETLAVAGGGDQRIPPALREPLLLEELGGDVSRRFVRGEGIVISEPLARHHRLSPGDRLRVVTRAGDARRLILGVFRDYRSSRGMAMISLDSYRQYWADDGVSSVVIYRGEGVNGEKLLREVRTLAAALPVALDVVPSGEIRRRSLEVFEQTFAVTRALRLLTVIVAFAGVFGALMLMQLDRLRQLAVFRVIGMTGGQTVRLMLVQTGVIGAIAGLIAVPLGLLMAAMLIHVINVRAFGWTLSTHVPTAVLGEALVLAVVAAILAGLYPAWRVSRIEPAKVLRDE